MVLLAIASCDPPRSDPEARAVELSNAEAVWASAGAPDYRLVLDHWTPGQVSRAEIVVREDSIISVTFLPSDRGEGPMLAPGRWPTIAGLFERARSTLDEADSVVIELHPDLGYVQHLRVDYREHVFDDEFAFWVRELELLSTR